jgi:hypothetical protein
VNGLVDHSHISPGCPIRFTCLGEAHVQTGVAAMKWETDGETCDRGGGMGEITLWMTRDFDPDRSRFRSHGRGIGVPSSLVVPFSARMCDPL